MSLTAESTRAIEVFYSYSHRDERLRNELEKHLSNLKQQGLIADWYDRDIGAGTEWMHEIDTHLNTAHIILLLISPDFMASDYCYSIEMKRAMERHNTGKARVIPILLRPVDYQGAPFGKLKALPKDAKPVTRWRDRDAAFAEVASGIRKAVEDLPKNIEAVPQIKEPQVGSLPDDSENMGPLRTQQFNDEIIDTVRRELNKLHSTYGSQVLPKNAKVELFRILRMLFRRKTFLEKVELCEDQNWGGRLRAASLTKKVLWAYLSNVSQFEPPVPHLYEQLVEEVDGYCMGLMGLYKLSEPHHLLDNIERYVYNADEFKNRLPDRLLKPNIPPKSITRCDKHLERIDELVNRLTVADARGND